MRVLPRKLLLELEGPHRLDQLRQVADADGGLGVARQGDGGAHLLGQGLGGVLVTLLVFFEDALQQRQALGLAGLGEAGKAALAAATARSTSAALPTAMVAKASSVEGSMTSQEGRG